MKIIEGDKKEIKQEEADAKTVEIHATNQEVRTKESVKF